MANLDSLSSDVLLNIVSCVDHVRDLAALSTQCGRLYQIIDMPTRHRYYRIRPNSRKSTVHAYTLLTEILKKPTLGSYVRQLELNREIDFRPNLRVDEEDDDENGALLRAAMKAAGFPDSVVKRDLMGSTVGMLLITVCPNIESLIICDNPQPRIRDVLAKANSKKSTSGYLQNLRDVKVRPDESYGPQFYNSADVMGAMRLFHRLPSIQTIALDGAQLDYDGPFKLTPGASNITRVRLGHSRICSVNLASIIRHSKALKGFKHSIGGRAGINELTSSFWVKPKTLGRALRYHKSTLQVLDIDVDYATPIQPTKPDDETEVMTEDEDTYIYQNDSDFEDADIRESKPTKPTKPQKFGSAIGSLHDFTALTHLSIGIIFLTGPGLSRLSLRDRNREYPQAPCRLIDCLPPSLEFLCLRGYREGNEHHTSMVSELMEKKAKRLPNLKEVQGVGEFISSAESEVDPDDLERIWKETDVWASDVDVP